MTLSYMSTQPQLLWRTAGINKLFTLGESKFTGTTLSVGGISKHSFPYAGEQFVCYRWKPIHEWSRLKAPFFLSKQTIRPFVHPKIRERKVKRERFTAKLAKQQSEEDFVCFCKNTENLLSLQWLRIWSLDILLSGQLRTTGVRSSDV